MRIERLQLFNFGDFAKRDLDFSGSSVVLLYGPNESGKSTLLQGLRESLFGFSNATYSRGGDLAAEVDAVMADGAKLHYRRRRSNRNTAVEGRLSSNSTPIHSEDLLRLLGGVELSTYKSLFGFSLQELADGGNSLQNATLAEALLGGSQSRAIDWIGIRKNISEAKEKLFKERGSKQVIPELTDRIRETRRKLDEASVRPATYRQILAQKQQLEEDLERLQQQRVLATEKNHQLQQTNKAIPLAHSLAELQRSQDECSHPALATNDWARRWMDVQVQQSSIAKSISQLEQQKRQCEAMSDSIQVDKNLLEHRQQVQRLRLRIPDIIQQQAVRNNLAFEFSDIAAQLKRHQLTLASIFPTSQEKCLNISSSDRVEFQNRHGKLKHLDFQQEQWRENLVRLQAESLAAQRELAKLPNLERLSFLTGQLPELDRLCQKSISAFEAYQKNKSMFDSDMELRQRAQRFSFASSNDGDRKPWPQAEVVHAMASEHDAISLALSSVQEEQRRLSASIHAWTKSIEELQCSKPLPTREMLLASRKARDQALSDCVEESQKAADSDLPLFAHASRVNFTQLEDAIRDGDLIVDAMLTDAIHLAQLQQLQSEWMSAVDRSNKLSDQEKQIETELSLWQQKWSRLWIKLDGEPEFPHQMLDWLEDVQEWDRQLQLQWCLKHNWQQASGELRDLLGKMNPHESLAGQALQGENPLEEQGELQNMVHQTKQWVHTLERSAWQRDEWHQRLVVNGRELESLHHDGKHISQEATMRSKEMAVWLSDHGLPDDLHRDQALLVIDHLVELNRTREKYNRIQGELGRIDQFMDSLQKEANQIVAMLTPGRVPLSREECTEAIIQLDREMDDEWKRSEQLLTVQQQIADLSRLLGSQQVQRELLSKQQAGLAREVQVDSLDEASRIALNAESHWTRARDIQIQRDALVEYCEGRPLDEMVTRWLRLNSQEIKMQASKTQQELERFDLELASLQRGLGSIDHQLASLGLDEISASLAAELQSLYAQLDDAAEQWMTLSIADCLLEDTLESFRKDDQWGVLSEVRRMFAELTDGRYIDVRPDPNKKNEYAVFESTGNRKLPKELSTGTREQLHLAIRLAFLKDYCAHHEPLPVVMDDCFVNFDDDRLVNTLKVLSDLGDVAQTIILTCHWRTVHAFREALPNSRVIELGSNPSSSLSAKS